MRGLWIRAAARLCTGRLTTAKPRRSASCLQRVLVALLLPSRNNAGFPAAQPGFRPHKVPLRCIQVDITVPILARVSVGIDRRCKPWA